MRASFVAPAKPLQALAQRELRVVPRRVDVEQALERRPRAFVLTGVVVRPPERLEDRAAVRLQPIGPFQHDRGLSVMATVEECVAALEQVVRALWIVIVRTPLVGSLAVVLHARMVARVGSRVRQRSAAYASRYAARSTDTSLGDSVRPGMRPRLAMGVPSITLMSPVKSIGVAPLMYEPTAYESTGAPAPLK